MNLMKSNTLDNVLKCGKKLKNHNNKIQSRTPQKKCPDLKNTLYYISTLTTLNVGFPLK